jgi:hypothetical protein
MNTYGMHLVGLRLISTTSPPMGNTELSEDIYYWEVFSTDAILFRQCTPKG